MADNLRTSLVAVLALTAAGCPSFSTLKTARALDKGETQLTAAPTFEVFDANGTTLSFPEMEVAGRLGILDGFDLGVKLTTAGGGQVESTIQLLRGGFDLALAPSLGIYHYGTSSTDGSGDLLSVPLSLSLLMGINLGRGHQLMFGPKLEGLFAAFSTTSNGSSEAITGFSVLAGGVIGVSLKLGPGLRLMPEVDVLVPVAETANFNMNGGTGTNTIGANGAVIFQGGLGLSFGGDGFGR